jgi:hypothetical protein
MTAWVLSVPRIRPPAHHDASAAAGWTTFCGGPTGGRRNGENNVRHVADLKLKKFKRKRLAPFR